MFPIQYKNFYKLLTHEDLFHVHKTLGIVSLTHFAIRFYYLMAYGNMLFKDALLDKVLLLCHFLLSVSSLMFAIPSNRVKSMIVIWPEFRAHSILFACRSLACISCYYAIDSIQKVRMVSCLITLWAMVGADMITEYFQVKKTTMRGMSWPNFFPMNNHHYQKAHNFFYSFSQIGATLSVLTGSFPDHPFMILLPIQIAPFLSTLVKKGIINDFHWHLVYTLSLTPPYMYGWITHQNSPVSIYAMCLIAFLRFYLRTNKYAVWLLAMIFLLGKK